MRIAIVVPGGVDRSGRERVIPALLWLIERLARRHSVLVIPLRQYPWPCRYPLLGAEVANLGYSAIRVPIIRQLVAVARLLAILTSDGQSPDVIHAFWADTSGLLAGLTGRILGVPVVLSLGGSELVWLPEIRYGGMGTWRGRTSARLAVRTADIVTAGSHHALKQLAPYHPSGRWLPLGVDDRSLAASPEKPPGRPWRLLHVGSINPVKDHTTLLESFRRVLIQTPACLLDCVGEDTLDGRIQHLAEDLGISEQVRFHGYRPLDEIIPLYQHAHLFLQASRYESQGVALLEAAAAGVPAVGTSVGLLAELAPRAGVAVPVADPQAMADRVVSLLGDSDRRCQLGQTAQAWARTHNADWTASEFETVYQEAINSSLPRLK